MQGIVAKFPLEKRFTSVEEMAVMLVMLLSPVSSQTTWQLINVDGGYVHLYRALANTGS